MLRDGEVVWYNKFRDLLENIRWKGIVHMVKVNEPACPFDKNQFEQFTETYRFTFPKALIEYLKQHNDAGLEPNVIPLADNECSIRYFYGTTAEAYSDIRATYETYKDRIPKNCVPIADSDFGNQICMSLASDTYGQIYFWNHETMDTDEKDGSTLQIEDMVLIAKSFEELLEKIEESPYYEDTKIKDMEERDKIDCEEKVLPTLYECNDTGIITETECTCSSQFLVAKKYSVLYREELPRFRKSPLNIYGLPFFKTAKHVYHGIGRAEWLFCVGQKWFLSKEQKALVKALEKADWDESEILQDAESAECYRSMYKHAENYELIWARISGADERIPSGYRFLGYDISYPIDCGGAFSIICDCMFICRWRGCDEEGTLFLEDFNKLNENGLFDRWQDAYDYMVKYLNEDWTERDTYGIYEVYMR